MGNIISFFFPPSKELMAPPEVRAEEEYSTAREVTEVTQVSILKDGREIIALKRDGLKRTFFFYNLASSI